MHIHLYGMYEQIFYETLGQMFAFLLYIASQAMMLHQATEMKKKLLYIDKSKYQPNIITDGKFLFN